MLLEDNIGMRGNIATSWKSQILSTTPNGTNFYKINGFQVLIPRSKGGILQEMPKSYLKNKMVKRAIID